MRQHSVHTDSKGRINLGSGYAEQNFLMTEENGKIILERAILIPERELWIHKNAKAGEALDRGIHQARKGKTKRNAIDIDSYDD